MTVTNGIYKFYIGLHTHTLAHVPVQSDSWHQCCFSSHPLEHFQQMFVEKFLNKDLRCDSCHLNLPGRRFLWQQRKIFLAETPFTVDGTHNIIVNDDFPPMKAEVYVHVSVCLHERAVFQTLPLCGNQPRTTCSEMPAFTVRTKRLTTNERALYFVTAGAADSAQRPCCRCFIQVSERVCGLA